LRDRIRATRAQTLIYIENRSRASTIRDISFFRACGIHRIIGAPLSRDLQKRRIVNRLTGEMEREAQRLVRCLAPLGSIDLKDRAAWDLRLCADERHAAASKLAGLCGRDFIAVNVGGKTAIKDWGDENWVALLHLMSPDYSKLALVFIGSVDEFDRSKRLAAVWTGQSLNLCGRLPPRESAAAMENAFIFLGHDSGPMHLAAAVGVPCLALFGSSNMPKWWHPMGSRHCIIHDVRGVRNISPAEVFSAVRSMMVSIEAHQRMESSPLRDL
jgi:ADP-heptose:LPS heptosyltransferase